MCDWVCEGYGGSIDREQLRVCCNFRRDLKFTVFKWFVASKVGPGGWRGQAMFKKYIEEVQAGRIQSYDACGLK